MTRSRILQERRNASLTRFCITTLVRPSFIIFGALSLKSSILVHENDHVFMVLVASRRTALRARYVSNFPYPDGCLVGSRVIRRARHQKGEKGCGFEAEKRVPQQQHQEDSSSLMASVLIHVICAGDNHWCLETGR